MAQYIYRAFDKNSIVVSGRMEASTVKALRNRLSQRNQVLLSARKHWFSLFDRCHHLGGDEHVQFCQQLALLVRAGVPLIDALKSMAQVAGNRRLQQFAFSLVSSLEQGRSLCESIRNSPIRVDPLVPALCQVGESSGTLPEVLAQLSERLAWRYQAHRRMQQALIYPASVLVTLGLAVGVLMWVLVPQMVGFLTGMGMDLPWYTQLLIDTSSAIQHFSLPLFAAFVLLMALLFGVKRVVPSSQLLFHRWTFRSPVIGHLVRSTEYAAFCYYIALMYSAGLPLTEALKLQSSIHTNVWFGYQVNWVKQQLVGGASLHDALCQSNAFSPLMLQFVRAGEMSGNLEKALKHAGCHFEQQAEQASNRAIELAGPIVLLIAGGLMLWVVFAVVVPIYDSVLSVGVI